MKKFVMCFMCLFMVFGIGGCSKSKTIKGYDVDFNIDMTDRDIKQAFSDKNISYEGEDYVMFEKVKLDTHLLGSLRFNYLENGDIDNIEYAAFDIIPKNMVSILNDLYGDAVHKENYNDKRNHAAYYVWDNDNVIVELAMYPLDGTGSNGSINAFITYYKNELISKKRDSYLNNKQKIETNIKKDASLSETYDTIVSRSSLEGHAITEAISSNATFQEYKGGDIYFSEDLKLFGCDAKAIYIINDPKEDKFNSSGYDGEITEVNFEIYENEASKLLPKFEMIFGSDYKKDNDHYSWSNSLYDYHVKDIDDHIEIKSQENYDIHLFDYDYNNSNDLTSFEPYVDCDIDTVISNSKIEKSKEENTSNKTKKYYDLATTITKSKLSQDKLGMYSYEDITFTSEDCDWIGNPMNKEGTVNQGAFYRKMATLLEGFNHGINNGSKYSEHILGFKTSSKDEFATYATDLSTYIVEKDSLLPVMTKFNTLSSIEGKIDIDSNSYDFTINDLTACAKELKISEEMLGYTLAMLDEYGPTITFEGNSYTLKLN